MAKYRKRPVVIEANQWFKDGDHPAVEPIPVPLNPVLIDKICEQCGKKFFEHGKVNTLEGHHIVCPGDWIITGVKGEHYPCKPDIFVATYEII